MWQHKMTGGPCAATTCPPHNFQDVLHTRSRDQSFGLTRTRRAFLRDAALLPSPPPDHLATHHRAHGRHQSLVQQHSRAASVSFNAGRRTNTQRAQQLSPHVCAAAA